MRMDPAPQTSRCYEPARLIVFDRLPYPDAWALQRRLVEARVQGRCPDTLLLLEHPPVYTVGRRSRPEHWAALDRRGILVHHVERGGSVTYHGPGQLVAYPILRLDRYCAGPRAYVRLLEEVVLRTVAAWGIVAGRLEKSPGVWIRGTPMLKLAFVGVRITHGVTMHGVALNVDLDLSPFERIVPCGIDGCRVTSMASLLEGPVRLTDVRRHLAARFADVFGVQWVETPWTGPLEGTAVGMGVAGEVAREEGGGAA